MTTPAPVARGLAAPTRVLLTLAAAAGAGWGIWAAQDLLGPALLAGVLVVVAHPVRRPLDRRGAPRWVGTASVIVVAYAVLIALAVIVALALGQFGRVLGDHAGDLKAGSQGISDFLAGAGADPSTGAVLHPDVILSLLTEAGKALLGAGAAVFFVFGYVLFMAVDAARWRSIPGELAERHRSRITSFRAFADATSRYFAVNSVFGLIVATIDGLALWALGIPAPFAWAVLAFVTNYIPNIGFVIGLVPPVVLAVVVGGWQLGLLVLAIYCVVNVVLQVLVQPHFVSRSVNLSVTLTFAAVVVWSFLLGPIGALLAVPLTLLARFVVVGGDPEARFARWLTGEPADPSPDAGGGAARS